LIYKPAKVKKLNQRCWGRSLEGDRTLTMNKMSWECFQNIVRDSDKRMLLCSEVHMVGAVTWKEHEALNVNTCGFEE